VNVLGKVAIDPGHGGRDPGAIGKLGEKEKDINLEIALKIKSKLETKHKVLLTRTEDLFVGLAQRAAMANAWGADVFISIHCNAASNDAAHGWEIWTSPGITGADRLATTIAQEWRKAFPKQTMRADWSDGDIDKEAGFTVLMKTRMPAVLIELGFITNRKEAKLLADPRWQEKAAEAIAQGIDGFFAEEGKR